MASGTRFFCLALLVACMACMASARLADHHEDTWMTLPATPTLPTADSSGLLSVNNISIWHALFSTSKANSGATVIFLHGGLGHSAYFGLQVTEVAKYRQVLSIDSRGHGRSSRDSTPYSYELMASDVLAVMDVLGIDKADIVGWSDGAIIGLVIARDNSSRLHSLYAFAANSDPSGVLDVSTSPVFTEYIDRAGTEYAAISPTPTEYDSFVTQITDMWASQPNLTAAALGAMSSNASNPIWIVDGDHEEAIKRVDTLFLADSNEDFGLVLLPRVSHFAFIQDPITFTASVLSWLQIDTSLATVPTAGPTSDAITAAPSFALLFISLLCFGML